MKVNKCGAVTAAPAPYLTYEEILKREGVYKLRNSTTGMRFIVLHTSTDLHVVLYYNDGVLQIAESNWERSEFQRVNEQLYLEVK